MSVLARRARLRRLRRGLVIGAVVIGTCAFAATIPPRFECEKEFSPIEVSELEKLTQTLDPGMQP